MTPNKILAARIGAPHGVKGEVRLISFTADPEAVAEYKSLSWEDGTPVRIVSLRPQGKALVARIEGVGDRNAAERITNRELFIDRSEFPEPEDEDEFYHADLIGLEARDETGALAGRIVAVHDFGAGDILEIKPTAGPSFLHPFTRAAAPLVDIKGGSVTIVRLPEVSEREEGE